MREPGVVLAVAAAKPHPAATPAGSRPDPETETTRQAMPVSVETFLRAASPFRHLPPEALRWLAAHLAASRADEGEPIVREGEPGEALYIVRRGIVQVVVADPTAPGGERELAQLGPGEAFGEQSLLSGELRAATVRALESVELYRLDVRDFETARQMFPAQHRNLRRLAIRRQRPRKIATWTMVREPGDGTHAILKNTRTASYLRLSEPATFLWEQMDGRNTVRDLTRAYLVRYGTFDLDEVLSVMQQLHQAGFVEIQELDGQMASPKRGRPLTIALRIVSQYVSVPHVDRGVSLLHSAIYRHLLTWPAQILLLLLAAGGAVVFGKMFFWHGLPLRGTGHPAWVIAIGIVGLAFQVVMHEVGHAVTCKHFGREVRRAGIGWYLFMPVAFVDTSDIWMAGRWPRIAVSIAGPYTNLVLSGIASLLVPFAAPGAAATLVHFALMGYVLGLMNLNPLIEYDGYYVLMDSLGIPNLRARALALIGDLVSRRPPSVAGAGMRLVLGGYGVLALGYTTVITYAILAGYHRYLEVGARRFVPHDVAVGFGWLLAAVMAWLIVRRAWHDLHVRRATGSDAD